MIGSLCEVVMLDYDGLRGVIDYLNFKHGLREGDPDWYDPDDWIFLFWCEQEYGSDCLMKLDVSDRAIEEENDWLIEYESRDENLEAEIYAQRWRVRVLEYLHGNTPPEIDTVIVPISY